MKTISDEVGKKRLNEFYEIIHKYTDEPVMLDFEMEIARIGEIRMPIQEYTQMWEDYKNMEITAYEVRKRITSYLPHKTLDDFI